MPRVGEYHARVNVHADMRDASIMHGMHACEDRHCACAACKNQNANSKYLFLIINRQ
jgi:hypothetical protein